MQMVKKLVTYLIGLLIIALGINVSKLAGLGISPVSAIPRSLEVVWGLSLGTTVIVVYCVLVLFQFMVLGKNFKYKNLLGVPLAIVFGWMIDLLGIDPKAIGHLLAGFPKPGSYPVQLVYLVCSITIIGFGVYTYLKPNLVPLPAEGLAQAISEKTGKAFGDCKTFVDVSLISIAIIIQMIFLGGFKSFTGKTVVVREGTIAAAVLVGQVVKFLKKKLK